MRLQHLHRCKDSTLNPKFFTFDVIVQLFFLLKETLIYVISEQL